MDPERLRGELRRVTRSGVAVSRGERQPGAGSVAAAVFGLQGDVAGAVSVCGPAAGFDDGTCTRLTPIVSAPDEEIDVRLGSGRRRADDDGLGSTLRRSGERREIRVLANRGGPGRPLSDHELALKFRLNVGLTVSDDGQLAALTEALEQLEQPPDVGALLTLTALPRD